jgi:hypothetical protein
MQKQSDPSASSKTGEGTEFSRALDKRPRKTHTFDVNDFFGVGDVPLPKIAFRVAVKADEDNAVVGAHVYVNDKCKGADSAKSDSDILLDAKTIEVLHNVCRSASEPEYPAFPSPGWMRSRLTSDHAATLLNLYNEVRKAEGPSPRVIDNDTAEQLLGLALAASHAEEEIPTPTRVFAGCNREALSELLVVAAIKLDVARREADDANAEVARLRALMQASGIDPEKGAEPHGEAV